MSVWIPKWDLMFLHVPKTGGTFVRTVLGDLSERLGGRRNCVILGRGMVDGVLPRHHALLTHFTQMGQPTLAKDRIFTLVRNPLAWYESNWRAFNQNPDWIGQTRKFVWHPQKILSVLWDSDPNKWLESIIVSCPGHLSRLSDLYLGPKGVEFVGHIGRTETLVDDLADFLVYHDVCDDRIRDEVKSMKRVNASDKSVPIEWDRNLVDELLRVESYYCERFGYEFSVEKK